MYLISFLNYFFFFSTKSCIHNTEKLNLRKEEGLKVKPIKLCKSLVDLLFSITDTFEFDVSFYHRLSLNNKFGMTTDDEESASTNKCLKYITIKSLALSLNSLSAEDNLEIYTYLEQQVNLTEATTGSQNLVNLVEFVSYVTCEMELSEALRTPFSAFTQKLLIQLQPIYISLSNKNSSKTIIDLLRFQTKIGASKYVRLIVII